jgi:mRNA-degrading endonuclease toxin of MazEF toxin-antitoxin module
LRPVLVLANLDNHNDLLVCMITAKPSDFSIELTESDFLEGKLSHSTCYVRPDRLFTAESTLVRQKVGTLTSPKMKEVLNQIWRMFSMDDEGS